VASYTVIAAYRFVDIVDGPVLRQTLLGRAQAGGLKGTVLLAPEGINLSLAGSPAAVSQWLQALQADPRFVQLELKQHSVNSLPFKKLLVKCKREIIRMNEAGVRPQAGRAPAISAATLQRWLQQGCCDEGRPVVLLDTRNAFEVDAGRCTASAAFRRRCKPTATLWQARPWSATARAAYAAKKPRCGWRSRACLMCISSMAASCATLNKRPE
jgi:UPF0176 protein